LTQKLIFLYDAKDFQKFNVAELKSAPHKVFSFNIHEHKILEQNNSELDIIQNKKHNKLKHCKKYLMPDNMCPC
jgi:hypothetical protein